MADRAAEEEEALDLLRDTFRGLVAMPTPDGETLKVAADLPTRVQAAVQFRNQSLGMPKQRVESTGADGGPLVIVTGVPRAGRDDVSETEGD